jgi:hypothetical protein
LPLREGVPKLLAYQRQKGGQKDRAVRSWRSLEISKIQDWIVLRMLRISQESD